MDKIEKKDQLMESEEFLQLHLEYQNYKRGNNTNPVEFPQELASQNTNIYLINFNQAIFRIQV